MIEEVTPMDKKSRDKREIKKDSRKDGHDK